MTGQVGILNVGAGDTKIVFDKNNPQDTIRAARIVRDMLRRGYALLVLVPGSDPPTYRRAKDFDEDTCEYIIADLDPNAAEIPGDHDEETAGAAESPPAEAPRRSRGRPRKTDKRVSAFETRGVAVARSAGG